MMNNIEKIVLDVLEENDCYSLSQSEDREQVAKQVANELISQSLNQLMSMFPNGGLEADNDGQLVLYTGLNTDVYKLG